MVKIRKPLGVVAMGIVLLATACTSNGSNDNGNGSLIEQVDPLYKVRAESALLSLNDFPRAWTSSPYEELDIDISFSEECEILGEESESTSSYSANSDEFTGPDGEFVENEITIYALGLEAASDMAELTLALDRCGEELETTLEKVFQEEGIKVNATISEITVTGFGESSIGLRALLTIPQRGTLVIDIIVIHQGRMVGVLSYAYPFGARPDNASNRFIGQLLEVVATRLEQAQE